MTDIVFRVVEVTEEAPDIRSFRMVRDDGQPLKPYPAGSHIDVAGPTGIVRQYSLCMPPDDPESILIAVKREDGAGGSAALHSVAIGDRLKVSKPRTLITIADGAEKHILIAGGIGVTPMLSMAYELYSRGADFTMHYFAHSREHAAFVRFLEERAEFHDRVRFHFGVPRTEHVAILNGLASAEAAGTHVYTCGPAGFMTQVEEAFAGAVGAANVHVEHFEAAEIDTTEDRAFTVELDTGEEFEIPAQRSILSVLEENGIQVFKSCEEGVCGSCVSGVLSGVPDHRDHCLSAADREAGSEMALCVSRAKTDRLVIELY